MALKISKLSAPRPVVIHNDAAFGVEFKAPGAEPVREDFGTDEAHAVALAAHAESAKRWAAWGRYQDTYDMGHLQPFIAAGAPTVFMVAAMSPDAQAALADFVKDGGKLGWPGYLHAVRYGVVDIKGLECYGENDQPVGHLKVQRIDGEHGLALDDASLAVFSDHAVLIEVAAHVIAASHLFKGLHKSG